MGIDRRLALSAYLLISFSTLQSAQAAQAADAWHFQGALRFSMIGAGTLPEKGVPSAGAPLWLSQERLRLGVDAVPSDRLSAEIKVDGLYTLGDSRLAQASALANQPQADSPLALSLYRAFATLYQGNWDIRLGIQRVSWGVGQLYNPSNIFSHVAFGDPTEELAGVPAFLVRHPLGPLGEMTLVAALDKTDNSAQAGIYTLLNAWETDWGLVVSWANRDQLLLAGWNMKGAREIGFWSEGRWARTLTHKDDGDWRIETGIDYTLTLGSRALYLSAEYYYRSNGRLKVRLPHAAEADLPTTDDGLSGKHYLYATAGIDLVPEVQFQCTALTQLTDPVSQIFSFFSMSWIDNLMIYTGISAPVGRVGTEFIADFRTVGLSTRLVAVFAMAEVSF